MRAEILFTLWVLSTCMHARADTLADAERSHSLQVGAATATVPITMRSTGRASLRLPALEFVFQLRPTCAEPFRAGSVSLTVADSRQSLNAEQLNNETATPELRLTVPASQIAPVLVSDFCNAGATMDGDATGPGDQLSESLTLPATLSANASLLCVSEDKQEIIYTTAPLDVILVCGPADETTE